jgi:hypothetical protein
MKRRVVWIDAGGGAGTVINTVRAVGRKVGRIIVISARGYMEDVCKGYTFEDTHKNG